MKYKLKYSPDARDKLREINKQIAMSHGSKPGVRHKKNYYTCKDEKFSVATFGKAFCIFRYFSVAKTDKGIVEIQLSPKVSPF